MRLRIHKLIIDISMTTKGEQDAIYDDIILKKKIVILKARAALQVEILRLDELRKGK